MNIKDIGDEAIRQRMVAWLKEKHRTDHEIADQVVRLISDAMHLSWKAARESKKKSWRVLFSGRS